MLGNQQGKVSVFRPHIDIFITVAVGCNNAVSIFVYYNAIGIYTEGTDIVLKLFRSVYNLAFVELIGEMREDYCRKFYPDSQIYPVGKGGDRELPADRFRCSFVSS